jgi:hypothetical protein
VRANGDTSCVSHYYEGKVTWQINELPTATIELGQPVTNMEMPNCTIRELADIDEDSPLGVNISFKLNGTYFKSGFTNKSLGQTASFSIEPQASGTDMTCEAKIEDYHSGITIYTNSTTVIQAITTLQKPADNEMLYYENKNYTIIATTNWDTTCSFYRENQYRNRWEWIGTSAIGKNHSIFWEFPCYTLSMKVLANCSGVTDTNTGIKIISKVICCPDVDDGNCRLLESSGAGIGIFFDRLTNALPDLAFALALVLIIGGIAFAISKILQNKVIGTGR